MSQSACQSHADWGLTGGAVHCTETRERGISSHSSFSVMSDTSLSTSSPTVLTDAGSDHHPKRLHADSGVNGSEVVRDEAAGSGTAESTESGEPEPPQKRVKVELDPGSELDIRFLISSKVSDPRLGPD